MGLDENDISQYYETISIHTESSQTNTGKIKTSDSITRIYACATMWHETQSEMLEMLKSIFRMDEDQSARRVAQKYLKVVDADYYEFESKSYFQNNKGLLDVHLFQLISSSMTRLKSAMSRMNGWSPIVLSRHLSSALTKLHLTFIKPTSGCDRPKKYQHHMAVDWSTFYLARLSYLST